MSRSDLELRLVRWLDDGPEAPPAQVLEQALRAARSEQQVGVIELPWLSRRPLSFPPSRSLVQFAMSATAIAVAVGLLVYALSNRPLVPATSPSPVVSPTTSQSPLASPGPSPSASPTASPSAPGDSPGTPTLSPPTTPSTTPSPFFTPPVGAWRFPELVSPGEYDDVSLAVDAFGQPHIAAAIAVGYGEKRGIQYIHGSGVGWNVDQVTTAPAGQDNEEYDGEPDIAVAPDGTVWIAFTRYDCGGCTPTVSSGVYVTNNAGGSWSKPQKVGGAQAYGPSIAAGDGAAFLAYASGQMPEAASYPVYFATNETGRWVNTELDGNFSHPQLALASDGTPRVAFATGTGVEVNNFPSADSSSFETVPGPSGEIDALFFTIDDAGRAHLVWQGPTLPMQHVVEDVGGSWSEPEDVMFDRLQPQSITTYGSQGELITAGRSLDESGAWFVTGINAAATQLAAGETVMTDLAARPAYIEFVYSYAGDQGEHGIWFTDTGTE